ncbi:MAG: S8 family serine peptidase [Planctomycetota bacterium]
MPLSQTIAATGPIPQKYVPNEIIVKFHQNVTDSIEEQLHLKATDNRLTLSQDLDQLNTKYTVKEIKPLFKNFRQKRRQLKELQANNKTFLTKKEKRILSRLSRAPKDAKVPELDRIYKLKLDLDENQTIHEAVAAYNNSPHVEYAELNYIVSIYLSPDDPHYPIQWSLNNTGQYYPKAPGGFAQGTVDSDIDAPEAWDISTGNSRIIVAVIDTGVDYNHRDLHNNIWLNAAESNGVAGVDDDENGYIDDIYGYDFINKDPNPIDDHGHGTHCSGIIAAEANNALDIAGVCWDARIMALKFLGPDGYGNITDATEAFYYAVENGADVTSNSWGGGSYFQTMQEAINYAYSQGVLMISAAGNDALNYPFYPAYYDNMFAVAATKSNDEKPNFSNYGDWVAIAAPGVDVLSLRANGTSMGRVYDAYNTVASGTSMACPHVAGACALLLSANPLLTCDEVYNTLMDTVDPIADGICLSDGRLNLSNAIHEIVSSKGRITFDRDYYTCSSIVSLLLADIDLVGTGTQTIALTTSGGDSETLLMTEVPSSIGLFTGEIPTTIDNVNIEDGLLQVSREQIITAVYEDANDGTGSPATAIDTAVADCIEPVIFNVHTSLPGRQTTVLFETDEPTTARVLCGLTCGGPYFIEGTETSLETSHAIALTGLTPETEYFFIVEAADAAGNETLNNNRGRCFTFTTSGPENVYVPRQYPTIQQAIDSSWDGGTVWVADGIYTGQGNRDIDFKGASISVRSENGPENCIIDSNGTTAESHRGFHFHSGEDANSVLDGFTIKNGYIAGSWYVGIGAAILCTNNSSPAINNCIFTNNSARWDGGAINNLASSPTITNCTFINNSAIGNDGGAINNENSSPRIENCTFIANSAYDWGGAVRNVIDCNPQIINCIFTANSADDGGAMFYFENCIPNITNCTFAGNRARNGNALACDSDWHRNTIKMTNCILADGGSEIYKTDWFRSKITITYSNVQGGYSGQGNIDDDPCFVDPGYWDANGTPQADDDFWVDGDYHLLRTSPSVDAGKDAGVYTDIEGNARPFDFPQVDNNGELPDFDMGAYELVPIEAQMQFTPRTLNCRSRGRWVKAHITLPEGISTRDIDVNTPVIAYPMEAESQSITIIGSDKGRVKLEILFNRRAFCTAVSGTNNGLLNVTIFGHLKHLRSFQAENSIEIIPRRHPRRYLGRRYLGRRRLMNFQR